MSTRSTIAYRTPEGRIVAVYCHWDGYPAYNGAILQAHYQEARKIAQLIGYGDISSLGAEFGKQHDFGARDDAETLADTTCTFYNRDRGEDTSCNVFNDVPSWLAHYDWSDYAYLWNGTEWLVHNTYTGKGEFPVFDRLEDVLEGEAVA